MLRRFLRRSLSRLNAAMAELGHSFVQRWSQVERGYRRPFSRLTLLVGFAFYPLLAVVALGWLSWDWQHGRSLAAAEDAIFDQVIALRPWEPPRTGQVAIVEIDECSIEHFRAKGEGGWPWSRQRHADLLDQLDRAAVRAVGYDVLFADPSTDDPIGDGTLEAYAEGGNGRFVFGSKRLPDDASSAVQASELPSAFQPIDREPDTDADASVGDPPVAILLPFGTAMARNSALLDISRNDDGMIRDVPLRVRVGDWALPTLPLRLVAGPDSRLMATQPATLRIDWRTHTRLPRISAADVLEGRRICSDVVAPTPELRGRTVLVGYTAAGLNDSKPTPVDPSMPGVEVWAEATEALLTGNAIWMPPAWLKYVLAGFLVLLTGYVFFRGEPSWDLDAVFVAINLALLLAAFVGLSAFGVFFDIFAAIGFVSLCFGLCRIYAATQRGRAIGNDDYRPQFDPDHARWLALSRLRFVPDAGLDPDAVEQRLREYRRRLRRFLYRGTDAVALDCVVEYKSWFWEALEDVTVLVWSGPDHAAVVATAERELHALHAHLAGQDDILPDDGSVRVACVVSATVGVDESIGATRLRVCTALGTLLQSDQERSLHAHHRFVGSEA